MESNQPTIFVLVDFSKAFDSVCYGLFILKLRQHYGFMLRRRHSSFLIFFLGIPISGWCSSRISYIATLCFPLFIDDMTEVQEFSIYHSRLRKMLFECIREVNSDMSKVFEWSLASGMSIVESFSTIFLMSPTRIWTVLCWLTQNFGWLVLCFLWWPVVDLVPSYLNDSLVFSCSEGTWKKIEIFCPLTLTSFL
jgi:hypothetical protein